MKISLIVPVFNIQKYLDECLNSIIGQSYSNIEVILVNDGSTDNSGMICDRYVVTDKRVKVLHTENNGLSVARNLGITHSSGDYIMFVDGDDFISQNSIEDIAFLIKKNPDVDLICGKMIFYYSDNNIILENFNLDDKFIQGANGQKVFEYFLDNFDVPMWSAGRTIYNKKLIKENLFQFYPNITSEDLELIPKIYFTAEKVIFYNTPFYYYRKLRPNSIMNTINHKRLLDIVLIIENYKDYFMKNKFTYKLNQKFFRQLSKIYQANLFMIPMIEKNNRNIVINEMKKTKDILNYNRSFRSILTRVMINVFSLYYTGFIFLVIKKIKLYFNKVW